MAAAPRRAVAVAQRSAPAAYGMRRRFLQERQAFRPAVQLDCGGFMPLADRIRDHLGASFPARLPRRWRRRARGCGRRARTPCRTPSSCGSAATLRGRTPAPSTARLSTSPDLSSCSARPSYSGPRCCRLISGTPKTDVACRLKRGIFTTDSLKGESDHA